MSYKESLLFPSSKDQFYRGKGEGMQRTERKPWVQLDQFPQLVRNPGPTSRPMMFLSPGVVLMYPAEVMGVYIWHFSRLWPSCLQVTSLLGTPGHIPKMCAHFPPEKSIAHHFIYSARLNHTYPTATDRYFAQNSDKSEKFVCVLWGLRKRRWRKGK